MDRERFDAMACALGAPLGRRAGLGALLAAATVAAAAGLAPDAGARRAAVQGPCGDGGVKANKCNKNADCCAGSYCDRSHTPKGAKGRCRQRRNPTPSCVATGEAGCTADADCCDEFAGCFAGTCQLL